MNPLEESDVDEKGRVLPKMVVDRGDKPADEQSTDLLEPAIVWPFLSDENQTKPEDERSPSFSMAPDTLNERDEEVSIIFVLYIYNKI